MILIIEDELYGFVNNKGKIIINPKYKYAESFVNGKAKVSNDCVILNEEHKKWVMNTYILIENKGNKIADDKKMIDY